MKELKDFKNIHQNLDIYVLASGKSVDYIESSFFDNKIVIGINQAYKKIPCQYLVRKENALLDDVCMKNPSSIIFISKGNKGQLNSKNLKSCEVLSSCENIVIFNHLKNENTKVVFPQEEDYLVVSYSTITSGIHLAAYMGAKNIILIGSKKLNRLYELILHNKCKSIINIKSDEMVVKGLSFFKERLDL